MKYKSFSISNYRAIKAPLTIDLSKRIVPLVGVNECGKTTILQAIFCFDENNVRKTVENTYKIYTTYMKQIM